MAYFINHENCHHYPDEWEQLLGYIETKWPQEMADHLGELEHHIEVKALYVFSMSQRLIERAQNLSRPNGWRSVFIESMILIFPMIELVGQARLGNEQGQLLGSGIDWLRVPNDFPRGRPRRDLIADNNRLPELGNHMESLPSGPRVRELYHLRNYFVHGLKNVGPQNQRDPDFDIGAIQSSINYELPYAISEQAKANLALYWEQLKTDDGGLARSWVTRLAEADIFPFRILGSETFEQGYIDPWITYWLSENQAGSPL